MEWIQSDEMDSGRLGMGPLALLLRLMALLVRLSISALGARGVPLGRPAYYYVPRTQRSEKRGENGLFSGKK